MRLLLDANIFLEALLLQEKAEETVRLLGDFNRHHFFMSDFALHVIGLRLFRHNRHADYMRFVSDVVVAMETGVLSLSPEDTDALTSVSRRFSLDFDDAYQYAIAQKHNLAIVSFDKDFDRTELGRKLPSDILRTTHGK